jgi:branched-chain amino acid transport system permease protein
LADRQQLLNNLDKPQPRADPESPVQKPTLAPETVAFFNRIFEPLVGRPVTTNQLYNVLFYLIALLVVIIVVVITFRLDDSRIGRAWTAIREDELAATAMGIPANKLKLGAFAVGASFAGAMGVLLQRAAPLSAPSPSRSSPRSIATMVISAASARCG